MDPATLLPSFPFLSPERQQAIISQLSSIDLALLAKQRKVLKAVDCLQEVYEPFDEVEILGRKEDVVRGKKLLLEGKIGCLIAAGGQGTRLGYKAPKGFFPITLI